MKDYQKIYFDLSKEVIEEINNIGEFILCNESNFETDDKYDLPRVNSIDKYFHYTEYAITNITKDGELLGTALDDNYDEKKFYLKDLSLEKLIDVLVSIKSLVENE